LDENASEGSLGDAEFLEALFVFGAAAEFGDLAPNVGSRVGAIGGVLAECG
jgi:hypothetical protein